MPLLLFGVAARRFGERISYRVIAATVLAHLGVFAVVFGSSSGTTWDPVGDGLAVVALVLFSAYFTLGKIARSSLSGITLQTHSLIAGTPVLLAVLVLDSGGAPVPSSGQWIYVMGLIVFPSTGHLLINWAHEHVTLTLLSLMTLGVPVLSVIGASVFFDETVVAIQVAASFWFSPFSPSRSSKRRTSRSRGTGEPDETSVQNTTTSSAFDADCCLPSTR